MPVGFQRSTVGAALLLALAASVTPIGIAGAEPRYPVHLEWTAPEECPTASEIEAGVQRLLGVESQASASTPLDVSASARRGAGGLWLGEVETRLGSKVGRRSIQTESCRAVADATALIVALMLDPDAVAAHRRPAVPGPTAGAAPPASSSRPPRPAGSPPPVVTLASPSPPTARGAAEARAGGDATGRVSVWLAALSALDLGTLPHAAFGAGLAAGIGFRHSTLGVGFGDFAKVSTSIAGTTPAAGGNFRLLAAWVAACPAVGTGAFDWGACARFELESMSGSGFGVGRPTRNSFRWAAVGGGLLGRLHLNRALSIPLEVGLVVPLATPNFTLKGLTQNAGLVHRPAAVSGRLSLGLALAF